MTDGLVVAALVAAVLIGVGAAAFLVMRSPAFWADAGRQLAAALLPKIISILSKRMDPETEAKWRDCQRRGGKWNPRTRKCE